MEKSVSNYKKVERKYRLYYNTWKIIRRVFLLIFFLLLLNSFVVMFGHNTLYNHNYGSITAEIYAYLGPYTFYDYAYDFDAVGLSIMLISFLPVLICYLPEKISKRKMYTAIGEIMKIEEKEKSEKQQERISEMKDLYNI